MRCLKSLSEFASLDSFAKVAGATQIAAATRHHASRTWSFMSMDLLPGVASLDEQDSAPRFGRESSWLGSRLRCRVRSLRPRDLDPIFGRAMGTVSDRRTLLPLLLLAAAAAYAQTVATAPPGGATAAWTLKMKGDIRWQQVTPAGALLVSTDTALAAVDIER